jgi:hypothetical protein
LTASSTTSWIRSRDRVTLRSSASRNACTLLSERPAAGERRAVLRAAPDERLRVAPLVELDLEPADFDRRAFEPVDLEPPDLEPWDLVAITSSSRRVG